MIEHLSVLLEAGSKPADTVFSAYAFVVRHAMAKEPLYD